MPNICNIEFSQPHCTSREYGPSFHQMGETCPHSVHRLTLRILSCRFAFGLTLMLALLETFPLLDANPVCKVRGEPCLYVIPHIFMTNMPYSTTPTPPICISHDGHQRPIQWLGEADAIAIRYSNVTTRLESTQDLDRTCVACAHSSPRSIQQRGILETCQCRFCVKWQPIRTQPEAQLRVTLPCFAPSFWRKNMRHRGPPMISHRTVERSLFILQADSKTGEKQRRSPREYWADHRAPPQVNRFARIKAWHVPPGRQVEVMMLPVYGMRSQKTNGCFILAPRIQVLDPRRSALW